MKRILLACTFIILLAACRKSKNDVILSEATITVLHTTCVKTICKIDVPSAAGIGVTWSDNTKPSLIAYQQVFEAGKMKNAPTTGLQVGQQYKVKIYATATGPEVICAMFDPVNSPSARHDIKFLP